MATHEGIEFAVGLRGAGFEPETVASFDSPYVRILSRSCDLRNDSVKSADSYMCPTVQLRQLALITLIMYSTQAGSRKAYVLFQMYTIQKILKDLPRKGEMPP